MVWPALISAGASLLGGAMSSRSAGKTAAAQERIAREQAESQERIADKQLQYINRMAGEQAAAQYPRMRAGNAALQNVTDIMGLGDIYAAPSPESLGGGQEFYPRAPVVGTKQQPSALDQFYNNMGNSGQYFDQWRRLVGNRGINPPRTPQGIQGGTGTTWQGGVVSDNLLF